MPGRSYKRAGIHLSEVLEEVESENEKYCISLTCISLTWYSSDSHIEECSIGTVDTTLINLHM